MAGRMRTRSACSFRLVPFCEVNLKSPGEPLYLSGVVTRNSPLWVSNPKQQIAYLGVKYWARLYCPEVILGVYSPDEVEQREEREINPAPVQRMSVQEITSEVSTGPARRSRQLTLMLLPTIFANALIQQVPLIRQKQSVRISNHRKRCWVLRCSPN